MLASMENSERLGGNLGAELGSDAPGDLDKDCFRKLGVNKLLLLAVPIGVNYCVIKSSPASLRGKGRDNATSYNSEEGINSRSI